MSMNTTNCAYATEQLLEVKNITKSFGNTVVLDDFSYKFERGVYVLSEPSGAGKTTLLRILCGLEVADSGTVLKSPDAKTVMMFQEDRLLENLSVMANIMLAIQLHPKEQKQSARERIKEALCGVGLEGTENKPVSELSGGQNTRLALAKMLLEKPNLLVLDEPTNHLDIETIAWLENYLVNYSGALIIVSHDRYFLDKVATITLDLTKHSLDRYVGNYSSFVEQKEQKLLTEAKNYEKQQKEIAALEDFVNRNLVRASTTKRAQSRRKQLEKMERLDKPEAGSKSANMTFHSDKTSGNIVLTVENAAIGYDGEVLSEHINLDLRKMNAVAVIGPNGVGKTTFIKSIVDQVPFIKGEKRFGANVEVGYYDQTQSKLTPSNTVLDELWNDFRFTPEVEIRNRLGAFLFSGDDVKKSVGMLSGGEKARLLLAKLSMENNNFLILDEPTNHLDIDSKEVLENALIDFDGTLLFVSHDRYFINRVATHVLELSENGSTLYLGDYDYYVEKKAELVASQVEEVAAVNQEKEVSPVNDYQAQKESQKELRKMMRQIESLEMEIEELENKAQDISDQMHTTNDADELMQLQAELDKISQRQEEAMLEWEELSEQV